MTISLRYIHTQAQSIPNECMELTSSGTAKRYFPVKFYEGTIHNREKEALFLLQQPVNSQTIWDFIVLNSLVGLGSVHNAMFQDRECQGNERFDNYQAAAEIFASLRVPEPLWTRREEALRKVFYNRFANDAHIIVPGYIRQTSIDAYGMPVSDIEIIPLEEKEEITKKLREKQLSGPITFWSR